MSKDNDDVMKRLRELDPQYEATVSDLKNMGVTNKKPPIQISEEDRILYDLFGAGAGAAASKGLANRIVAQRLAQGQPIPPSLYAAASPSSRAMQTAPTAAAPSAPTAGAAGAPGRSLSDRILQGTIDEAGATGRARTTGFNVQTAQEAAGQRQMTELIEEMRRRGIVGRTAQDLFSSLPGMTATPSGVLTPRSEAPQTAGPKPVEAKPFMGPPTPPETGGYTMQQKPGALQQAAGMARRGMGAVVSPAVEMGGALLSSPRVSGAMGGVGTAEGIQQYMMRKDVDPLGAKVAAGSTAGSLLSLLPQIHPVGRVGSAVLSPLALYLYDKYKPYKSVLEQQQTAEQAPQ